LLFLSSHFPLPKIGSPNLREILVFGPVYRAIVFIHFDFFCNGASIGKKS
jgi:hypothetical protein